MSDPSIFPLAVVLSEFMANSSPRTQRTATTLIYGLMLWKQIEQLGIFGANRRRGRRLPYVTLILAAVCFIFYFFPDEIQPFLPFGIGIEEAAIRPRDMIQRFGANWPRLFTAALVHASDSHLYYNLVSLIYKGALLERQFGSARFASMCVSLTAAAHLSMVGLSYAMNHVPLLANYSDYYSGCVGISALLFAWKVILNHDPRMENVETNVGGFVVSNKYAAWVELILIQLAAPEASFLGHLGGIFAGLGYLGLTAPFDRAGRYGGMLLAVLTPVRSLWRAMFGGDDNDSASGRGRNRFNHNASGYRLGGPRSADDSSSSSSSSSPISSSSSLPQPFTGPHHRFPSPTPATIFHPDLAMDGEGQIRPSAPPVDDSIHTIDSSNHRSYSRSSSPVVFTNEMATLYSMGLHDRKANHAALTATNGDVQLAIDRLLGR